MLHEPSPASFQVYFQIEFIFNKYGRLFYVRSSYYAYLRLFTSRKTLKITCEICMTRTSAFYFLMFKHVVFNKSLKFCSIPLFLLTCLATLHVHVQTPSSIPVEGPFHPLMYKATNCSASDSLGDTTNTIARVTAGVAL